MEQSVESLSSIVTVDMNLQFIASRLNINECIHETMSEFSMCNFTIYLHA